MLIAAPIVRKPMDIIGAPGMTDFVKIYIASELNKSEYRTTLRHEQAHVWAGHNRRRPKESIDKFWKIACEMEIARTIYDVQDLENISAPRSRLSGGYVPRSIDGLPDEMILAEDIYDWLLSQPEESFPESACTCTCDCNSDDGKSLDNDDYDPTITISLIREKLDANEILDKSKIAGSESYNSIRHRVPSLTEAVDAALRVRVERERSYRRTSRREGSEIILPGKNSIPRPPLVEIFVDRSGSFSHDKTAIAENKLAELLQRYGVTINSDVWYFGNGVLKDTDFGSGGDTPYHLICQHLAKSIPKLAVIITDDDPVSNMVTPIFGVKVICIPIGCYKTNISVALSGIDVQ